MHACNSIALQIPGKIPSDKLVGAFPQIPENATNPGPRTHISLPHFKSIVPELRKKISGDKSYPQKIRGKVRIEEE